MEKKKLLLVAISVGVFLVISIAAAILVFQPRNGGSGSGVSRNTRPVQTGVNAPLPSYQLPPAAPAHVSSHTAPVDAVSLVRNPSDVPGLKPAPEGVVRQSPDYYVNVNGSASETVISVPKPSSAAVPDTNPAGRAAPAQKPAAITNPARPAAPATAASAAPASKPAAAQKPAATAAAAAKPATKPAKVYNDYWVQTGAFSTMAKAEGVKETLASKGITSIIENRDVNGSTLFRVRVGPYTSQNEASYWLSLIKTINGFEESQIRQTQSVR